MRPAALLAAAAALACNQRDAASHASGEQSRHALESCLDAVAQPAGRDHIDHLPPACTRIATAPRCRAALDRPTTGPLDAWFEVAIAECAPAYCAQLAAPQPRACGAASDPAADFDELWVAILVHELAIDDPDLVARLHHTFAPVVVTVARSAAGRSPLAPRCDQTVIVTLGSGGAAVTGPAAAPRGIEPCAGAPDRAAIATELCRAIRAATCSPQVVIEADRGVAHGDVVAVMDLAKAAGVTRLAISLSPRDPGAIADRAPAQCGQSAPAQCP